MAFTIQKNIWKGKSIMKALIDLHTHALSSGHAYSTVKENI